MLTVGEPEQEPESGKVNINTASMRELMEVGFEKRAAALIVNERKKFGRFRDLDDLAKIPEISGRILRKLRDNLEV
jgi:competence ComEA-like helix-hairpin-helix protein